MSVIARGTHAQGITNFHSANPLDVRVPASRLNPSSGNWADVTCAFGTISATRLPPREIQLGFRFLF